MLPVRMDPGILLADRMEELKLNRGGLAPPLLPSSVYSGAVLLKSLASGILLHQQRWHHYGLLSVRRDICELRLRGEGRHVRSHSKETLWSREGGFTRFKISMTRVISEAGTKYWRKKPAKFRKSEVKPLAVFSKYVMLYKSLPDNRFKASSFLGAPRQKRLMGLYLQTRGQRGGEKSIVW